MKVYIIVLCSFILLVGSEDKSTTESQFPVVDISSFKKIKSHPGYKKTKQKQQEISAKLLLQQKQHRDDSSLEEDLVDENCAKTLLLYFPELVLSDELKKLLKEKIFAPFHRNQSHKNSFVDSFGHRIVETEDDVSIIFNHEFIVPITQQQLKKFWFTKK